MTRIQKLIYQGNLVDAKIETKKELELKHKVEWEDSIKAEYKKLYPEYEVLHHETEEDYKVAIANLTEPINMIHSVDEASLIINIRLEQEITLEQYKNETRVIKQAISPDPDCYLCGGTGTKEELSSDGDTYDCNCEVHEITELVRPYTPIEITDGMIQSELEKYEEYRQYKKNQKEEAINKLIVENNGVKLDAHNTGRADMAGVLAVANFRFNQLVTFKLGSGMNITQAYQEAYSEVYKDTVSWKGSDDTVHNIQIESVGESAFKAFDSYAKIIGAK